ncbi:MAG: hypothetical protein M1837_003684 [Sclerophora amabilis]|nr:MAG: hypothetical protein M1837_003684 [Sclerophora amabilis]
MAPHEQQPGSKPQLSLYEKLGIIPAIVLVLISMCVALVKSPFRGLNSPPTLYKYVVFHAVRRWLRQLSVRQQQYLEPSTTESYKGLAKEKGFEATCIELSDGTKGCWIGSPDAEKVILFFHGGGFIGEANRFHLELCWNLKEMFREAGKDVSFVVLAYDLAPHARYPRQILQSVEMLGHLINVLGKRSSNIMLLGDSAGGHMAAGTMSHISHPHPHIPALEISENLRGAVLLSPWVDFDTNATSMTRNGLKDLIHPDTLNVYARSYMGCASVDQYNQPGTASAEWWASLKIDDILVVAGKDEVLLDGINRFAEKLKSVHEKTTSVIVPNEAHVSPVLERMAGHNGPFQQEEVTRSWLLEHF